MQNYDIVNTGREVLAQLITTFEQEMVLHVSNSDKAAATKVGNTLLEAYSDLDELVVTTPPRGFILDCCSMARREASCPARREELISVQMSLICAGM